MKLGQPPFRGCNVTAKRNLRPPPVREGHTGTQPLQAPLAISRALGPQAGPLVSRLAGPMVPGSKPVTWSPGFFGFPAGIQTYEGWAKNTKE